MKYIKKSPKAKEKVQSYLKEQNGRVLMVTLDVRTRWNSTFDMLMKFIQLKDGIQQFLVHLKSMNGKREFNRKCLPDLEEEDWALLSGVCVLCQPFKDATTLLSGEKYPTFCHAFPLLRTLKSVLSQEDLFEETFLRQSRGSSHLHLLLYTTEDFYPTITLYLKACQRTILESFTKQFTGMDINILWITYLDPTFRKMKHMNDNERRIAKTNVVEETVFLSMEAQASRAIKDLSDEPAPSDVVQMCYTPSGQNEHREREFGCDKDGNVNLLGWVYDSPPRNTDTMPVETSLQWDEVQEEFRNIVELEFANYLNNPVPLAHNQCPLGWWRDNRHVYPNLACTAQKWLCVC